MALRHEFPQVVLPDLRKGSEPEKPPMVPKRAVSIEFRPGMDPAAICESMMGLKVIKLSAAVGAGKSTMIPRQLAKTSGLPVVHVVPSRLLAMDMCNFLSSTRPQDGYAYAWQPKDAYSEKGVTLTSSAAVWAKLLSFPAFKEHGIGFDKTLEPLGKVWLFLDESHESDAYTYALHRISHEIPGIAGIIFSSATHTPETFPMREAAGNLDMRTFEPTKPSEWDPLDSGKPWSMAALSGSTLIFIDHDRDARALMTKYNQAGATAYRLKARMDPKLFKQAMDEMRDPRSGIVVLIADYSFRSGFNMDTVETIIDSCVVQFAEYGSGTMAYRSRVCYELENHQAFGRGARMKGSHCVLWRPKIDLSPTICVLEGVEMDAAAVLFRLCGYAVPVEIRHARFSKGNIPSDIVAAFNAPQALGCLPGNNLQSLVAEQKSAAVEADVDELAAVLADYTSGGQASPVTDLFAEARIPTRPEFELKEDGSEFLRELQAYGGSSTTIIAGRYYKCHGMPLSPISSRLYGVDWKRAVVELRDNPALMGGFADGDRMDLICMLLVRYDRFVATHRAIDQVLLARDSLTKIASAYPVVVRDWSDVVAKDKRECDSMMTQLSEVLNGLRPSTLHYEPLDALVEAESSISKSYADMLLTALPNTEVTTDEDLDKYIRDGHTPGTIPGRAATTLTIDHGYSEEVCNVEMRPCRVGKRQMFDLVLVPDRALRWHAADYIHTVHEFANKQSLDTNLLRSIKIRGDGRVDPDTVIQGVRDQPRARRTSRSFVVRHKTISQ